MAEQDLQEFFRAKQARTASAGTIDWQAKKDHWLEAVEKLYDTIVKCYLAKPVADGTVKVSYEERTIAEEHIGQYGIRDLVLQVGDEKVVFSPRGANVVGAAGRIDLCGDLGEVTLVLQPGDRWGVVAMRTPILKVLPLDEKSLLTSLQSVMRQ